MAIRRSALLILFAGFGFFPKVVPMERIAPPRYVVPSRTFKLEVISRTGDVSALRRRIATLLRQNDPSLSESADAPFVMRVDIRSYLGGNNSSIDGEWSLGDRHGREIAYGSVIASNAGALRARSAEELIDDAAESVARII